MKIIAVPPGADQNARLASIWKLLQVAEREQRRWLAALYERGEGILRRQGDDDLADVLRDARLELAS